MFPFLLSIILQDHEMDENGKTEQSNSSSAQNNDARVKEGVMLAKIRALEISFF
jgi:hypothetical protein